MSDTKISALTSGVPAQAGDLIPAAREISDGVYGNVSLTADSIASLADGSSVPSDFQAPILPGGFYTSPVMFPVQDVPEADQMVAAPFWCSYDITWTKIGVTILAGEEGAKIRLGVYESGPDNRPGALLVDAGEVDCSTEGNKELDVSLAIPANTLVWLASVTQTTGTDLTTYLSNGRTGSIGAIGSWPIGPATAMEAFEGIRLTQNFAYGPLPDPFGSADGSSQFCPLPYLRTGV